MSEKIKKPRIFSFQVDYDDLLLATDEERKQQDLMRESTTFFKDGVKRFKKNPVAMTCLFILLIIIIACIAIPIFWPYSYEDQLGVKPGAAVDSSFCNLKPMEYGSTELIMKAKYDAGLEGISNAKYEFTDSEITYSVNGKKDTLLTYLEIAQAGGYNPEKGNIEFSVDSEKPKYVVWRYSSSNTSYNDICLINTLDEEYVKLINDGESVVHYILNEDNGTIDYYTAFVDNAKPLIELSNVSNELYNLLVEGDNVEFIVENGVLKYHELVSAAWNNLFKISEAKIAEAKKPFPHLFGTDNAGRDYFIRVIFGARVSLSVGLFASIIVLIIGTIYGSISGYAGGKTDLIMMRIVDIIYALPDMLIIILLSVALKQVLADKLSTSIFASLGANMISIFIVFGLLYWVSMARLIRGQILSLKEQEYILAAKSIGSSATRIIRKHLLPNCISVIIISTALQIPSAIFTESFLSFLGLGVAAPMPSLGSLASDALSGVFSYTYRLVIPAVFICLIVLSLNLLGDGLRDAFDPKLKN